MSRTNRPKLDELKRDDKCHHYIGKLQPHRISITRRNKKREVVKQQLCSPPALAFLSDVKWTSGRVVVRSQIPRGCCKIDVYFDVNTNIVYAIIRLLRSTVSEGDCVVHVFYLTLTLTLLAVILLIAHSPVGARVKNYVFVYKKRIFLK